MVKGLLENMTVVSFYPSHASYTTQSSRWTLVVFMTGKMYGTLVKQGQLGQ